MLHVLKNAFGNVKGVANVAAWGIALGGAVYYQAYYSHPKPPVFTDAERDAWNDQRKEATKGQAAPAAPVEDAAAAPTGAPAPAK
jgi:hypothetical protein